MKTVLYVAPKVSVKGGISTAIMGLLGTRLSQEYDVILVASNVDGWRLCKAVQGIAGLMRTLYYLAFRQIDIVHLHGGDIISVKRKYFYFRLAKAFHRRVIYHFHGASFMNQFPDASPAWKQRIRSLFEGADVVICPSESWRLAIEQIAPRSNVQVVCNSVPLPVLDNGARGDRAALHIAFLGLIGERKGVFDLIEAVSRLVADGYNIQLTVGGNGDVGRLTDEIETRGLREHVRHVGWIVEGAKDELFRNTDVLVLPSYGEGMPMAILEAMSYGIPVISTTVGGIPELVSDGETGLLIEPGDVASLCDKIRLLSDSKTYRGRLGANARQAVADRHNIDTTWKRIAELYEGL